MSVKEQMSQAKELIQAKRYDEARAILKKVDHPTAKQWIERIDAIKARQKQAAAAPSIPDSEEEAGPISGAQKTVIGIIGACAVITIIAFLVLPWLSSGKTHWTGLTTALNVVDDNAGRGVPSRELVLFSTWIIPFVTLNSLMVVVSVFRKGTAPVGGTWRYFLILSGLTMIHFVWLLLRLLFSGGLSVLGFGYWLAFISNLVVLGIVGTLVYVKRTAPA
jgi:hypothetical protein